MRSSTLLVALVVTNTLHACCTVNAAERVLVLRGERCPPGTRNVSAEQALQDGASDCLLLDPSVRVRINPGAGNVISAAACAAQSAEIRGLGGVVCSQPDLPLLRLDHPVKEDPEKKIEEITLYTRTGPLTVQKGSQLQRFFQYFLLPGYLFVLSFAVVFWIRRLTQSRYGQLRTTLFVMVLILGASLYIYQMFLVAML